MSTLYEIDSKILACVDYETGEVIDQDQLDALQIERGQKIEGIACWIKNLESDIQAIEKEEEALAYRREAKGNKVESLKEFLKFILNASPFESAKCKVSFRKSTRVNITNEEAIPNEYKQVITDVKIDRNAIKEALKFGELVDGAELVECKNIQIR